MKTSTHIYSIALTGSVMKCLTCIFFPLLKSLTESRLKWNRLLFQILDLGAKPTLKLFFYIFALWLGHVSVSIFSPKKSP